jgi:uncharacterized protein (TIGR03000 family)
MSWCQHLFALALLAAALLLTTAAPAAAQRGRSGGGRISPGNGGRSFATPRVGGGIGGIGGLNRAYHSYYHNGNYYRSYPFANGYPFFFGVSPYGYLPYALGYGAQSPYPDGYIPPVSGLDFPEVPPDVLAQAVRFDVLLPTDDATVWVEGQKTNATGKLRSFLSPVLAAGTYTYRVAAAWKQEGQDVRIERTLRVMPGNRYLVDFTRVDPTPRMPPADD